MRLSPPTTIVWWICLIMGLLGVLLHVGVVSIVGATTYAFWMVAIALLLMLLATRMDNF